MHIRLFFENPKVAENSWITRMFLGTSSMAIYGIDVDSDGNVYSAGGQFGSDATPIMFKHDKDGGVVWQRAINTAATTNEMFRGVVVDSSDNVFVVGSIESTTAIFAVKYNSAGTIQWQRKVSPGVTSGAWGCDIDSSGNLYVVGEGTVTGGTVVLIKYDTNGNILWKRKLGNAGADNGYGVHVAGDGSVYICGATDTASFSTDMFVAKYTSAGSFQWFKTYQAGSTSDAAYSLTSDSTGVYFIGRNFITGERGNSYIAKIDTSGNLVWQRMLVTSLYDNFVDVVTDGAGSVYVTGNIEAVASTYKGLIFKYNSSGTLLWQRTFEASNSLQFTHANLKGDRLYVTGSYARSDGNYDWLVLKIPTDGSKTGTYSPFTYSVSSFTESAGNLTVSAGTMTDADATDFTGSTPSYSTPTINFTSAVIPL